jgi:hypothetical protein
MADVPASDSDDSDDDDSTMSNRRRRLLQFSSPSSVPRTGPRLSLTSVFTDLASNALESYGVRGLQSRQILGYFHPGEPTRTIPSLQVNGSIDLDAAPFNRFGLHGELDFQLYVWPWYESVYGVPLSVPERNLMLAVQYPIDLDLFSGVKLTNVWLAVRTSMGAGVRGSTAFTVGGQLAIPLPDQSPLILTGRMTMFEGSSQLQLDAALRNWRQPFGISGLVIESLIVSALIPQDRTQPVDLTLSGSWRINDALQFQLAGKKRGDLMALGASVGNLSFAMLGDVYRSIVGSDSSASPWEERIVFKNVFVGVANGECSLLGVPLVRGLTVWATVDIFDFQSVAVQLAMGSAGIEMSGSIETVPSSYLTDGMTLNNLTLQFSLPSSKAMQAGKQAAVYLSGGLTYKSISLSAAIYVSKQRQLLIGSVQGPCLSQFLPFVPSGCPWDLKIDQLLVTFSPQLTLPYPNVAIIHQQYPAVYATANPTGFMLSGVVSVPYLEVLGLKGLTAALAVSLGGDTQRITSVTIAPRSDIE